MSARPARYDVEERHRIGRFETDFKVAAEEGPLSTPERLARQVRAEILPALEDVFAHDSVVGCDARIETLEIDLGAWPADPDWPSLRDTLREQLLAALAPYLQQRAVGEISTDQLAPVEPQGSARPSVDNVAAVSPDAVGSPSGAIIPLVAGDDAPQVSDTSDKIVPLVAQPDPDVFTVLRAVFGRSPQGFEKALAQLPDGAHRQALQRVLSEAGAVPGHYYIDAMNMALIGVFTRAGHPLEIAQRNATTLTARLLVHPEGAALLRRDSGAAPQSDAGLPAPDPLEGPTARGSDSPAMRGTAAAGAAHSSQVRGEISDADKLRADWKVRRASVAGFLAGQTAEELQRLLEHLVPASPSEFHQTVQGVLADTAHPQKALLTILSAILDETPVDIEALRRAEKTAAKGVSPEAEEARRGARESSLSPSADAGLDGWAGRSEWAPVLQVFAAAAQPAGGGQRAPTSGVDRSVPVPIENQASPRVVGVGSQPTATSSEGIADGGAGQPSGLDRGRGSTDAPLPQGATDGAPTQPRTDKEETTAPDLEEQGADFFHASSTATTGSVPSPEDRGAGADPAEHGAGEASENDTPERLVGPAPGASGDLEAQPGIDPATLAPRGAKVQEEPFASGEKSGISDVATTPAVERTGNTRGRHGSLEEKETREGRADTSGPGKGATGRTGAGASPAASESSEVGQKGAFDPTAREAQDRAELDDPARAGESAGGSDAGRDFGDPESRDEGPPPPSADRLAADHPATDHPRAGAADAAPVIALVEAAFGEASSDIIAIADMIWDAVPGSFKATTGARTGSGGFEMTADAAGESNPKLPVDVLLDLIARAGPTAPRQKLVLQYIVEFASPEADDRQTLLRHVIARLSYPVSGRSPALRREVLRGLKELFDETSHPAPEPSGDSDMAEPQTPDNGPKPRILSHHAGLVLFHPYYKLLFSRLQLLTEKNELQPDQLGRARSVLAALAGEAEATAPLDPLVCVLLGVPDGATPPPPVPLTEEEAQLIEGLIRSVIAQWSALGQTSPAGLQEAFIRRGGQLWIDATGAHLRVDPGPFDVLLDSLPWSLDTVVALPWMPVPCHVMWRTQDG
ncbi:contractile injection system tape measure protein [uncultured Roseobacter sp.]|uniref:contractile injection system tape measure protein n=1 Tax=uncultured Roseobacter sp. TaxID=114847 RepID=UPI0026389400|nr:contractile injection system tape measure protein [uncultured Roseobacter sp.]